MEIILVRHGKTKYSEQHRYCGALDPELSERGRAELQCAEVRTVLQDDPPELVFCSPLKRALESAELLCEGLPDASLMVVPELREIDFGAFEGKTYEELKDDPAYQAWLDTNAEGPIPGGDFPDRFREDAVLGFESVLDSCEMEGVHRAMVVTHGGVIGAILEEYAAPRRAWYEYRAPCGGYYVLQMPDKITKMGGGATC